MRMCFFCILIQHQQEQVRRWFPSRERSLPSSRAPPLPSHSRWDQDGTRSTLRSRCVPSSSPCATRLRARCRPSSTTHLIPMFLRRRLRDGDGAQGRYDPPPVTARCTRMISLCNTETSLLMEIDRVHEQARAEFQQSEKETNIVSLRYAYHTQRESECVREMCSMII